MSERYLPAEWEPQSAVLLTWPHDGGDWAPYLALVEPVFVNIAAEIARRQGVVIVYRDDAHLDRISSLLRQAKVPVDRVVLYCVPSNDTWARDHGPIGVKEGDRVILCDFHFDGWGKKFDAELDDRISSRLHGQGAFGETELEPVELVLEGGAVETDGEGTLLAVKRCVLDEVRNPGMTQQRMEGLLQKHLGLDRFLWLDHGGLDGDDTDGHVDTLARFCDPHTIAYQACDDPEDPNHDELKRMERQLQGMTDRAGNPYRLVPLPSPGEITDENGDRLPAGYANFLIINGAVLAPTYNNPADTVALQRLADCFPDREIVAIDCAPLILQYGSLHCVTMQLIAG